MPAASLPADEIERLAALRGLRILDTPADPAFDDLTRQAMEACDTPVALVSLVDEDRQWFKSRYGVAHYETPRDQSICAHALLTPDRPLIVPDTQTDTRFSDNPLVDKERGIRFYAGIPLRSPEGHALGTLCVIDYQPRQLASHQLDKLRRLAQQISLRLSLNQQSPAERRLAFGFGAGFALLLFLAVYFSVQVARFLASDQWVGHTHEVIQIVERTLFELQAAESSQRGYTASGQDGYLPPYHTAAAHVPVLLANLHRLITDNPLQTQRFSRLKAAVELKLSIMQERIEQRRTLGAEALEARYLNGAGRHAMEMVIFTGQKMIKQENWLLRQRAEVRANGLRIAIGLLIGTSILGSALLAAGFLLTRRELRRSHGLGTALAQANIGLESEVAERRRAQQRLSVQHSVAHVAAEYISVSKAAPDLLKTICEHLDWELGELWTVDPVAGVLRLSSQWHRDAESSDKAARMAGLAMRNETRTLAKGECLPGRVWEESAPIWETDLAVDACFPSLDAGGAAGVCRAFAFPMQGKGGDAKIGSVMMFVSHEQGAPDAELVATMQTLANQITQFSARCEAQAGLQASQARFTAFLENAPAVAYIKDEEGRMLYGNETLLRTFGFCAEDWLGKTDFDLWPAAASMIRENDKLVLAGGQAIEIKESVPLPDGSSSQWLSYKFPLRDEGTGAGLVAGISVDITAREKAEAELRREREIALHSLREKEMLLQEVHHRVKNNLQIIGSLLSMQARRTKSPVALAALGESASRVRSIALVHEKLYRAVDLEYVDAADYLRTLSRNLMDALGTERLRLKGRVALDFELESGHNLDASVAIACGLILNEALTNSLKHGFPGERSGRVIVGLRGLPGEPGAANGSASGTNAKNGGDAPGDGARSWLRLEVRDDGVGLSPDALTPAGTAELARNSLGLRLVRDLTKQVAGRLDFLPTDPVTGAGLVLRLDFAFGAGRRAT